MFLEFLELENSGFHGHFFLFRNLSMKLAIRDPAIFQALTCASPVGFSHSRSLHRAISNDEDIIGGQF